MFFGYLLFFFNIIAAISSYFFSKIAESILKNNFLIYLTIVLFFLSGLMLFNFNSYVYITIAFLIHQIIRGYYSSYSAFVVNTEIPISNKSRTTVLSFQNFFNALTATIIMSISGILVDISTLHYSFVIISIFGGILICCTFIARQKKEGEKYEYNSSS